MTFDELRINSWIQLWQAAKHAVENASSVEACARIFNDLIYATFDSQMVLSRVFMTVRYADLPDFNRQFVDTLATKLDVKQQITNNTPVLSLLATRGLEESWNDRRQSGGHIGIPFVSGDFVSNIPMVSRLLNQLGMGVDWLDETGGDARFQTATGIDGLFFVPDAASSKDNQGRAIIPAQDFVAQYGVKTVFGLGGRYMVGDKNIVSTIFFTNQALTQDKVNLLLPILKSYKVLSGALLKQNKIFEH